LTAGQAQIARAQPGAQPRVGRIDNGHRWRPDAHVALEHAAAFARASPPSHSCNVTLPAKLAEHLRARRRLTLAAPEAVPCAVLIPLLPSRSDYEVVYTLRTDHLPSHKGQVAFPGGKKFLEESLVETALRESAEEIGIDPSRVEIIGCLDDVYTMATQYVITPWVGVLPPNSSFQANPYEVADIFTIALRDLRDPRHHASQKRHWNGTDYDVSVITAGRHEIWGATHSITMNFLERLSEI
jgi:8-oxo-dGTP pyrophosphatase MutT (NUDIX family)